MISTSLRHVETSPAGALHSAIARVSRARARPRLVPRAIIPPSGSRHISFSFPKSASFWSQLTTQRDPQPPSEASAALTAAALALKRAIMSSDIKSLRDAYEQFQLLFTEATLPMKHSILAPPPSAGWLNSRGPAEPFMTPKILRDAVKLLIADAALLIPRSPSDRLSSVPPPPKLDASDVHLARRIYQDSLELFKFGPSHRQRLLVLAALSAVDPNEALASLDPSAVREDYEIIMRGFAARRDTQGMRAVLDRLRNSPRTGVMVDMHEMYYPYILSHFPLRNSHHGNPIDLLSIALGEMRDQDGVSPPAELLAAIISELLSSGNVSDAGDYVGQVKASLAHTSAHPNDEPYVCATLIDYAGALEGYDGAMREARSLQEAGLTLGSLSLRALLLVPGCPLHDEMSLIALANSIGTSPDLAVWSTAMRRAAKSPDGGAGLDLACSLYAASKRRGVQPDAAMVDPLIHGLCTRHQPPTTEDLEEALEVYYDLRDALHSSSTSPSSGSGARNRKTLPDRWIYTTLLSAISRCRQPSQETTDLIIQLLIDMRNNSVTLPPSFIQNAFINLLQVADSHESAYRLYTYLREVDSSVLDATGYASVLEQLAKMSFEDNPLPSQANYLDAVRDMQDAGVTVTSHVYTVLLSRYRVLATRLAEESQGTEADVALQERLLKAVKRVHLTLKIDATVTPDVGTLNALMNTYNWLGAYHDAFAIWEQLSHGTSKFDHASISIVLDVCGRAGDTQAAQEVWNRIKYKYGMSLGTRRVIPNANNYASYIECCGRLGDFDSALDAFKEMVRSEDEALVPRPTAKVAEVVTKFSWSFGRKQEVEGIIQEKLPELFTALPQPSPDRPAK